MRADETGFSVCLATVGRAHCAQRLVRSVRERFPRAPILVADQGEPAAADRDFYAAHGVECVLTGDVGVAEARNRLAARVVTEYFLLCDDDFILDPGTEVSGALAILDGDRGLDVVGGRIVDLQDLGRPEEGSERHWECFLHLDPAHGTLLAAPISLFRPIVRHVGPHRYFLCDAVLNFAMMRTSLFTAAGHGWDPRFRCNGEHEDFYLTLKTRLGPRVAYHPRMWCYHHSPPDPAYTSVRLAEEGWRLFAGKWGVEQYVDRERNWRPFCRFDARQPLLDDASFAAAPDFTGAYAPGWRSGQVGLSDDLRLHAAGPEPATGPRAAPRPSSLGVSAAGDLAELRAPDRPGEGGTGPGLLTPTGLEILDEEVRRRLRVAVVGQPVFRAGRLASVRLEVLNGTGRTLPMGPRGGSDVWFSYHLARAGTHVVWDGERSRPISDLFERSLHLLVVRCPDQPGEYRLEVDIVVENVGWAGLPCRFGITVTAAEPGPGA